MSARCSGVNIPQRFSLISYNPPSLITTLVSWYNVLLSFIWRQQMPTPWGISSEWGFYRPNLTEIIESIQQDLKDYFGNEINVGDNSVAGILAKMQAGREFKSWQQLEATYNSQTLNGAEGEFLDELYAYQGIPRNAATFGTGAAIVETDSTSENIDEIVAGVTFSSIAGAQYVAETSRTMSDFVKGYKIEGGTLATGTYTFTVTNADNLISSATYALVSNDDADKLTFFNNLKSFFDLAIPNDTTNIIVNSTAGEVSFYVGFTPVVVDGETEYVLVGTEETFKLKFGVNRIGNRFSEHSVLATETGYNPLAANNINSILPTPDGYVSVTNIENFFSGSDVETDAAYAVRATQQADAPHSGTRPSILAAILAIDEVVGASLDKNVDSAGVVSVEPIIFGGETEEIAQVLYDTQPANNQYIGDISYTIATEDGKTEVIQFSRGTDLNMSVRVEYKPLNGIPLAASELLAIQNSVEAVNSNIPVGGTVFIGQLSGAVFDANPQRFTQLVVRVKEETDLSYPATPTDFTPDPSELPRLAAERVEIIQIN